MVVFDVELDVKFEVNLRVLCIVYNWLLFGIRGITIRFYIEEFFRINVNVERECLIVFVN